MVPEIAGTTSLIKAAIDITKAMVGLRDEEKLRTQTFELRGLLLDLQGALHQASEREAHLRSEIRDLTDQIASFNRWTIEKEDYIRKDFGGETFAMVLKTEASNPTHRLCCQCFDQHSRKSVLQKQYNTIHAQEKFFCPACNTNFQFGPWKPSPRVRVVSGGPSPWMTRRPRF
ncbi:hypothetical protein NP284_22630 [Rhodopseudomonas pseudopalustris]|uniref:hypothetical protein n=1 Tax=Rhodopseudomonas pseudopalustris TaxID=1513892 RepID=UPI003F9AD0E6